MTIQPGFWDYTIYKGGTFTKVIKWSNSCGEPLNLTGYTAKLEARYKITDTNPFLDLTTENGGITIDALAGTVTLNIDSTSTAALIAGKGVYDMQMIANGIVDYLLQGKMTVQEMVTRP